MEQFAIFIANFVSHPWLALVVAGGFIALWWWSRSKTAITAAIAWAAYSGYEHLMFARILCTGECNIRVDLLLIYPLLFLISLLAVILGIRARAVRRRRAA